MKPILLSALVFAAAEAQAAGVKGAWAPFTPMPAKQAGYVQRVLGASQAEETNVKIPSGLMNGLKAGQAGYDALGALRLPEDFDLKTEQALFAGAGEDRRYEVKRLAEEIVAAYQKAVPGVRAAVRDRALDIAKGIADGTLKGEELTAAAEELKAFSIYGTAVQDQVNQINKIAQMAARTGLTLQVAHEIAASLMEKAEPAAEPAIPEPAARKNASGLTLGEAHAALSKAKESQEKIVFQYHDEGNVEVQAPREYLPRILHQLTVNSAVGGITRGGINESRGDDRAMLEQSVIPEGFLHRDAGALAVKELMEKASEELKKGGFFEAGMDSISRISIEEHWEPEGEVNGETVYGHVRPPTLYLNGVRIGGLLGAGDTRHAALRSAWHHTQLLKEKLEATGKPVKMVLVLSKGKDELIIHEIRLF